MGAPMVGIKEEQQRVCAVTRGEEAGRKADLPDNAQVGPLASEDVYVVEHAENQCALCAYAIEGHETRCCEEEGEEQERCSQSYEDKTC